MEELNGHFVDELKAGMTAVFAKTITDADILLFAGVSGDMNPVHLNQEYASRTRFGGRIVHGMLTASFISAVLGTKLPGPGCIYVSQNLRFLAPVRVGDTVCARVTVLNVDPASKRVKVETTCTVGEKPVVAGEAELLVPRRTALQAAE